VFIDPLLEVGVRSLLSVFLLLGGLLMAGGANAGTVAVTFAQVGSDVVVTAAGSLSSISGNLVGYNLGEVVPSSGKVAFGIPSPGRSSLGQVSCSVSPTSAFGTGGQINATSFSGDQFDLEAQIGALYVRPNFTGGSINSTMTLANTQLSSLGLTSGGVTYTCGADTITVNVAPSPTAQAVPSLSEWAQLMLALIVMTVIGWHFHRERSY